MLNVLVTGANGFIGRNLCTHLKNREDISLLTYVRNDSEESLEKKLLQADVIFHLAAVNRPTSDNEFDSVNRGLTEQILNVLRKFDKKPKIVFSSSTQAIQENAYGHSKLAAEKALIDYGEYSKASVYIYRLTNVFGKWCRPNYNSVVATFCHNIAHDLDIQINNPEAQLNLVYIDDVVSALLSHLTEDDQTVQVQYPKITNTHGTSLQQLADTIQGFRNMRSTLILPDFSDLLTKYLYTTYLSYLPEDSFSYKPLARTDDRGSLVELLKSESFGQIFVSSTRPGITRGNHYHHTKVEKFCVVSGEGVIRFRHIERNDVLEYPVFGREIEIVDIPPGYTHSIENTGSTEMIVLFWANEIFSPDFPDTYYVEV